ncbi:MAG TPA: hypothetical protein DCG19_08320 [Cryomorphaceae bacterium]|nr:hypothetical protein [Owenweeksia sp.]HAD97398.1 hypothetical protein [Cryomorphaceae bacterium]HBF18956.1 hypothetical protein [Cryomorphaceae bacterium]|tara:strand:- start:6427 stop:7644 length:1218 start_codon:yes stop_codon:yes gene_type:complete
MKYLLLTLSLMMAPCILLAQQIDFDEAEDIEEYQQWVEKARADSSMLFVMLSDERNVNQQRMEADDALNDAAFIASVSGYKALRIPVRSEMGARWVQLFPSNQMPAFYFLQEDELLLQIRSGYQTSTQLREAALKAKSLRGTYSQLSSQYGGSALTIAQWKQLLYLHGLNFPFRETLDLALEFMNGLKETQLMSPEVLPVLVQYGVDLETKYPEMLINNRKNISAQLPEFDFNNFIASAYSYNLDLAVASEDSVLLEKLLNKIIPLSDDSLTTPGDMRFETQKLYAEETGQFSVLKDGVLEFTADMENDSLKAEAIFDHAFDIADRFNTQPALKAARALATRANELNENFRYRMLEGYMAYLMKDYDDAEMLVRKAATLSSNPNNQRKAQGLMEMITRENNSKRD